MAKSRPLGERLGGTTRTGTVGRALVVAGSALLLLAGAFAASNGSVLAGGLFAAIGVASLWSYRRE